MTMDLRSIIVGFSIGVVIGWSIKWYSKRSNAIPGYTDNYPIQEVTTDQTHTGIHSPVTG